MVESRILGFMSLQIPARDRREVSRVAASARDNFKLREGVKGLSKRVEKDITTAIAETVVDCRTYYALPIPDINLLYEWNDDKGEDKYKRVTASADVDEEHPEGVISFSPRILNQLVTNRERRARYLIHLNEGIIYTVSIIPQSIRVITAHEMYHLEQAGRFPNLFRMHSSFALEKAETGQWSKLRFDRAAQRFGDLYFTAFYKETFPDEADVIFSSATTIKIAH